MKLVSEGMLEKVKHSFRLSQKCMADKERARAKEALCKVAGGGTSGARQQVRRSENDAVRRCQRLQRGSQHAVA